MTDRAVHRSHAGVASYDCSRWLAPPPPTGAPLAVGGAGRILLQTGASTLPGAVQEVLVDPPGAEIFLLLPDTVRPFRGYLGARALAAPDEGPAIVTIAPDTATRWVTEPTSARAIHLHLPPGTREQWLGEAAAPLDTAFRTADARLREIVRVIAAALANGVPDRLRVETLVGALLVRLARRRPGSAHRESALPRWQAQRALAYMRDHLHRPLSLAEIAAVAGLSPFHFARAFAAREGMPPHQRLLELRLARARELLEEGDLGIAAVAAAVGYPDAGYFARLFRRTLGFTPRGYRSARR